MSDVARLANLSAFQRDVLWTLEKEPGLKGVALRDRLQEYYGEQINTAQVYMNLDELAELGLVEKERRDGRTNAYRLTEDGQRSLIERKDWTGECDS